MRLFRRCKSLFHGRLRPEKPLRRTVLSLIVISLADSCFLLLDLVIIRLARLLLRRSALRTVDRRLHASYLDIGVRFPMAGGYPTYGPPTMSTAFSWRPSDQTAFPGSLKVCCPHCESALTLHQPDTDPLDRLLAKGGGCKSWFRTNADVTVFKPLPKFPVVTGPLIDD